MKKSSIFVLIFICSLLINGCGQSGPLYLLPKAQPAKSQPKP